jgi:multidrug efflux pump subunit AcrA (membrane-fusion protein)
MMWFRVVGLIVVVIVIAAMGGWWLMRGQTGAAPAAALAEASKSGDAAAEKQTLPKIDKDALTLPGIIEPYESVPVSAKLTANIASMKVRDSTLVAKGELLCVLDDIDLRQDIDAARLALMQAQEILRRSKETHSADLERKRVVTATAQTDLESFRSESAAQIQQAEAALRRAQIEAERYQKLYQSNAISEEQVRLKREAAEDAQTMLEQDKAAAQAGIASRQRALEQAQLEAGQESVSEKDIVASELAVTNARNEFLKRERKRADIRILSPVGGTVHFIPRTRTTAMVETGPSAEVLGPGVRVYEGDPFLEIATTERACVRIEVDETDIGRLHIGMPAKITGDAFAGRELTGRISEIQTSGRKAGQGVTLFPVTVLIGSPLKDVRMGMTADVTIRCAATRAKEKSDDTSFERR